MTTDMEAAKAFYADVIGWGTQDASMPGMPYTLFTAGKTSVSGIVDLPEDARKLGMRPSWLGYVGVNDVDATAARIRHSAAPSMSPRPTSPTSAASASPSTRKWR